MKKTENDGLIPISRMRAWALLAFGPADSWDHPLTGTRYDSVLRQRADQARRDARRDARESRLRARG